MPVASVHPSGSWLVACRPQTGTAVPSAPRGSAMSARPGYWRTRDTLVVPSLDRLSLSLPS